MAYRKVARAGIDYADSIIVSGTRTVYTNNRITAFAGSKTAKGSTVVQGSRSVYVENKPIARMADNTTKGPIKTGSTNVYASDNNKIAPIKIT